MKPIEHFKPQVEEIICELFVKGYTADELIPQNELYWWQHPAYEKETLHYENAELTLVGWLNVVELTTENRDTESFNLALMQSFADAIEYQWDVRQKDLQEDMERELVVELEGVA